MSSQANIYHLHNSKLHIAYSSGALGSKAGLVYQDSQQTLQFDETQLRRVASDLGEEVSVTIRLSVDAGSTTFTLMVPRVQLDVNQHVPIQTIGVTSMHRFSIVPALNHGQLDSYHVESLNGSAGAVPF